MIHISTKIPLFHYECHYFTGSKEQSHVHDCFLFVFNGAADIQLDNTDYSLMEGDIIFIPNEQSYSINCIESSLLFYICIHPFLIIDTIGLFENSIKTLYNSDNEEQKKAIGYYLSTLIDTSIRHSTDYSPSIFSKLYDLFNYIQHFCVSFPSIGKVFFNYEKTPQIKINDKTYEKLTYFAHFLNSHYMENTSLSTAAEYLNLTPQYLSSFLKNTLGLTYQECLNQFRIQASEILLKYSDESPTRIAMLCGFPNYSSFQKAFESMLRMTIDEYLLLNHKEYDSSVSMIEGIPFKNEDLILDYLFNRTHHENTLAFDPTKKNAVETIIADYRTGYEHTPISNFMINMGSAKDYDKPTFRHQITLLQSRLHFQYGRCTEFFKLTRIYSEGQNKYYDFSKIFQLIDFMYSINLTPFLDIDCKPFILYRDNFGLNSDYRQYLQTENYDSFLYDILSDFLKACISRYGFDRVSTWKFEIWRRYNTNMTSVESVSDFHKRFQKLASIIKECVPGASIGGPGFNGFMDLEKFQSLISPFAKAEIKPDFISAYYFPYTSTNTEISVDDYNYIASSSLTDMTECIGKWKFIMHEIGLTNVPLFITEYSAHISVENYINDSLYPAMYVFHQAVQALGNADALGYWLFSDLALEYGKPNAPLFGGNGILSKHAISKPVYFAHEFLNNLGETTLAKGLHHIITKSTDGSIQLLLFYPGLINPSFAASYNTKTLLQYPYSAFLDTDPIEFSIQISHLPSDTYLIKERTLDINHGNVLSIWGQMNHIQVLSEDDINYMTSVCVPDLRIHTEKISNVFSLRTTLSLNEAKLFILKPQHID